MEKTRVTRQKQVITDILHHAGTPLTAGDIYARAVAAQPSLAKSTVYRNLDAMVARGELVQGNLETGERFYELPCGHGHTHYMVCKQCSRRVDLPDCPLEKWQQELADAADFTITDHVLQLYGYCHDCREAAAKKSANTKKTR